MFSGTLMELDTNSSWKNKMSVDQTPGTEHKLWEQL